MGVALHEVPLVRDTEEPAATGSSEQPGACGHRASFARRVPGGMVGRPRTSVTRTAKGSTCPGTARLHGSQDSAVAGGLRPCGGAGGEARRAGACGPQRTGDAVPAAGLSQDVRSCWGCDKCT